MPANRVTAPLSASITMMVELEELESSVGLWLAVLEREPTCVICATQKERVEMTRRRRYRNRRKQKEEEGGDDEEEEAKRKCQMEEFVETGCHEKCTSSL